MFRMQVEIYANEELFAKESLEFLKEKFDEKMYDLVTKSIQSPEYIEIPVWPGTSDEPEWIRPEDLFNAIVNNFKSDGLTIIVRPDEDKFDKSHYNIPDNYMDVYYKFVFRKEDFDSEEIENGEFEIGLDGDSAYAYDPDEDEEVWIPDIEEAEWVEFY